MKVTFSVVFLALVTLVVLISWLLGAPPLPALYPDITSPSSTQEKELVNYIEVIESCGPHLEGECLNVRSGPGSTFPAVAQLRTGVVLAVATTTPDVDGITWYRIVFNEWVRYPGRISKEWYVASPYVRGFTDTGAEELETPLPSLLHEAEEQLGVMPSEKRIVIDRSEQTLSAYEGDHLFLESPISTGLDLTPTPRGTFSVYRKTPSRYMQGPLPGISDQYYDLPGVPWNMYFTQEGGAIHGAYWHAEFGKQWSHGCVNLPLETARTLYEWTPLGTSVLVQD